MNASSASPVPLLGRLLISTVFIFSGISKVLAFSTMTGFAAAKGMPLPAVAIGGAAVIEILGGLAVLTGFQAKVAAWILFVYLIPTTVIFHNFWTLQGADRMDAEGHFLKNLAIMGGLLFLSAFGPGAFSADGKQAN
jgi:putative oxidoreductase